MPDHLAQLPPGIDLGGLVDALWGGLVSHLPSLGGAILAGLEDALRQIAEALWNAAWASSANLVTELPADLTINAPWYQAVAVDPAPLALGAGTLAIVLLGLRTMLGAAQGRDSVATHITGRLIPATFAALAYPVLVARAVGLVNDAATGLGRSAIGGGVVDGLRTLLVLPLAGPIAPVLLAPVLLLWLILIWYGVRLAIRLAYSLYRFLVALLFGPVAIVLWAIPQTEWLLGFWVKEVVGWGTTPLLVTGALAMAIPLASGRNGFLAAAVFGIAGLQAAYDVAGLLGHGGGGRSLWPITWAAIRSGASSATPGGAAASAGAQAAGMRSLAHMDAANATERFYGAD